MAAFSPVTGPAAEDGAALRAPPHSLEAEQAVIGGLLLDNDAWDKVSDILVESDFYTHDHRVLFASIRELAEERKPYDTVTLSECLKSGPRTGDPNIFSYLAVLAKDTPSSANIAAYAHIVREKAVRRHLIAAATAIIEDVHDMSGDDSAELVDRAEQRVFDISDSAARKSADFLSMRDLSISVYNQVEERRRSSGDLIGLATGFSRFDDNTSGLQNGELVIIAGRPSTGKTSLALNIAEHIAFKQEGGGVALFSMEMPANQIATRLYSSLGKINQMRLRSGRLNEEEWARLTEIFKLLQPAPIFVDDSSSLTPTEVRARVRRLKRECKNLSLVIVDYLQLMRTQDRVENRATEISEISRSLKALAKEMEIPVIALSQLNRSVEIRQEKRPQMSDLRESGAIEQDADLIAMLYRDKGKGRDDDHDDEDKDRDGVVKLEVVKQRNGPTFTMELTFLKQFTRFENYFPDEVLAETMHRESKYISDFDQM